jgi:single-strand DNA-binding protein
LNKVILIGNLAADPESRTTSSGVAQCTFRLATQRRFANASGVREADFHTVVCWRNTAEFASKYLLKGRRVAVEGSIQNRSYDAQDGSKRYVTEIVADNVEFLTAKGEAGDIRRVEGRTGATNTGTSVASVSQTAAQVGFEEVDDDDLPF